MDTTVHILYFQSVISLINLNIEVRWFLELMENKVQAKTDVFLGGKNQCFYFEIEIELIILERFFYDFHFHLSIHS